MSTITVSPTLVSAAQTAAGTRTRRREQHFGRPASGRPAQPSHPGRMARIQGGAGVASCAAVRPAPVLAGVSAQERRMLAMVIGFALVVLIGAGVVLAQFFSVSNAPVKSATQPAAVIQQS